MEIKTFFYRKLPNFNVKSANYFSKKSIIRFLEAPITGGMDALKKGQMACFVAGDKEVFEQAKTKKKS